MERKRKSIWEHREAHPHTDGELHAGTYADKADRSDTGTSLDSIGQPFGPYGAFTPMIHSAPITRFTHHHVTIPCPHCSRGILWDESDVLFNCAGCGGVVDGKALQAAKGI